jgi:alkanesulfonate monooxygenase SsuD/methylene tetrahydromethanopterin reductase-like flavin-dependent oxidoreductase (luciferase family)
MYFKTLSQEATMSVPVGLNIWSRLVEKTFPYLDQTVGPFDSIWMPDHVQYNGHNVAEGWSLLAYAMARYPDKLCGHQVLCNSFRNPAHLAKMAATMQVLSGGQFILGIGAGWNEEEYLAYGWPFPSARIRIEQLAEAIQLIKLMWTERPAFYQGQYYQITNAHCEPQPDPIPPIMVGGSGEKYTLRVVAQHADWWNHIYKDRTDYAHKQEVLKDHCRAVGRDYDEIQQALAVGILMAETEEKVQWLKEQPETRPIGDGLAGTPDQITEQLLEIVEQGADRIIINFADAPRVEGTHLFATTVLPHLS